MRLVKLDAIDSTNDFLKALSNKQFVDNFTVVSAESQTNGRGQMGAVWTSEAGKNLTMSVLIKAAVADIHHIFTLNIAVALAVIQTLEANAVPDLSIKWPNDIMSGNKKLGGILIENSVRSNGDIDAVVGIGLNVNQINFENLPKASSLNIVCNRDFDKEVLLVAIVERIEEMAKDLAAKPAVLWQQYTDRLFKKGIPMPFEDLTGKRFMGIITGVNADGKVAIQLEDDSVSCFEIKQIQMLY